MFVAEIEPLREPVKRILPVPAKVVVPTEIPPKNIALPPLIPIDGSPPTLSPLAFTSRSPLIGPWTNSPPEPGWAPNVPPAAVPDANEVLPMETLPSFVTSKTGPTLALITWMAKSPGAVELPTIRSFTPVLVVEVPIDRLREAS